MTAMESRPDSRMRCSTASSSSPKRSASTTNTTRSASASAAAAVRFMARLSARFSPRCSPGVSTKASLHARAIEHAEHAMARGLRARRHDGKLLADQRVEQRRLADVGPADERGETRAECGGRPRVRRFFSHVTQRAQRRLRGDLFGAAPARPFSLGLERGMRHGAGNEEGLRMRLAAGALDGVHRQRRDRWPAGVPADASWHP